MDDVLAVRHGKTCGTLFDDVYRTVLRQGTALGEFVGDRPAFDQLHLQEELIAMVTEVVDSDEMRVVQPGSSLGLAAEALGCPRIAIGRQHQLDRDLTS